MEIWKRYNDKYEVSNYGNVKKHGNMHICAETSNGYLTFGCTLLHRAVAKLYIPNPENKPCVDHINTNKHDNRVENLRWVTHSENNLNSITRKKNSESCKKSHAGKNNGMYGKQHTKEWRKNHSEKMKGTYMNDNYIQLKVKPEFWGEFIDNGFKFGKLNKSI